MSLKIVLFFLGLVLSFSCFPQQPKKLTKKFFSDPNIQINTPAFQKKLGFTSYKKMMQFMNNLAFNKDFVRLEFMGRSQKRKEVPIIYINKGDSTEKVKVWLQGGLHGNEPASSEGMLMLFQALVSDPKLSYLLDKLYIAIVPRANVDGYERQNRYAKNGLDLNRDQVKLQIKESLFLKSTYTQFSPHIGLDYHEFNPFRAAFRDLGQYGYTTYFDLMFLSSGDLNIEPKIRDLTKNLFIANAQKDLDEEGYHYHNYISAQSDKGKLYFNMGASSARSSATSYALANSISILMEIRGIKLNRTSFKRRVYITYLTALSYLKTAYENAEAIKKGIEEAIASTLTTNRPVVVNAERLEEKLNIPFIDIAKNKKVEDTFIVANALKMKTLLTRQRPYAYILSPEQTEAVKNLRVLGIEVDVLKKSKKINVESYRIISQEIRAKVFQGFHENIITSETFELSKTFPSGTYIVYLNQKNANLAVTALEPENLNSFIRFRVIDAKKGQDIPIYRYMKKIKIE